MFLYSIYVVYIYFRDASFSHFCYNICMKILVTGGCGYIGGFMVKRLLGDGHSVVVVDSMERGHRDVDSRAVFIKGDLRDKVFVKTIFADNSIEGIIHFAAYIAMGESMENPYIYFYNNILASLNLAEEAVSHGVKKFIFSSTAGVYGNPVEMPIPEDHPKNPENPYGESKWMVERILGWYQKTKGLSYACLRYFNAAGAELDGSMGEAHDPESHLIPNILRAVLEDRPFILNGDDYKTLDGTCVRDYIHVLDLVDAHVLALQKLEKDPGGYQFNVGTGKGYSNKEVISVVKKIVGHDFPVEVSSRRPGDANELVAEVSRIRNALGFSPQYSDIETIVKSAWEWHRTQHEKHVVH